ncbi:MAG: DNA gyrase inhibitor YacG [Propionivibrio sp.]
MSAPAKKIRCPQCGGESLWSPENRWRPFCSERCKLIDLGAWASEEYRVPVQEQDSDPLSASEAAPGTPRSN